MTRTTKTWAIIVVSVITILLLLVQRKADDARMQPVWERKYHHTRMQITWHLMNLRHEYASRQVAEAQNSLLDVRALWDDRDVLFHLLHHREAPFPSDSLIRLETMIDHRTPLINVLREIERVDSLNGVQ